MMASGRFDSEEELLFWIRENRPGYADLSDAKVVEKWLKKYPYALTPLPASHVPQNPISHATTQTIKGLRGEVHTFPLLSAHEAKVAQHEMVIANHRTSQAQSHLALENVLSAARIAEIRTQHAPILAEGMLLAEAEELRARIEAARGAAALQVPLDKYGEIKVDEARANLLHLQKERDMQLEVQKDNLETSFVVDAEDKREKELFRKARQLLDFIKTLQMEVISIRESDMPEEVKSVQIDHRRKSIRTYQEQYEATQPVALGQTPKRLSAAKNSEGRKKGRGSSTSE